MGHLEHRTAENSLQRKGAHELDVFDPGTDSFEEKKKTSHVFGELSAFQIPSSLSRIG